MQSLRNGPPAETAYRPSQNACCGLSYEAVQNYTFGFSLVVQVCVLIASFISFFFPMTDLLHKIAAIEFAVQVVEFVWYLVIFLKWRGVFRSGNHPERWPDWLKTEATPVVARYIDWWFSTPAMLCSILLALAFFQNPCARSLDVANEYGWAFPILIVLDWLMLLIGALAEGRYYWKDSPEFDRRWILGAGGGAPLVAIFVLYFWLLGENLYSDEGFVLLLITLVLWTLYGVVAVWLVAPQGAKDTDADLIRRAQLKNAWYNILDLFSKNAMGIIITVVAFTRYGDGLGGDDACSPPPSPPPPVS